MQLLELFLQHQQLEILLVLDQELNLSLLDYSLQSLVVQNRHIPAESQHILVNDIKFFINRKKVLLNQIKDGGCYCTNPNKTIMKVHSEQTSSKRRSSVNVVCCCLPDNGFNSRTSVSIESQLQTFAIGYVKNKCNQQKLEDSYQLLLDCHIAQLTNTQRRRDDLETQESFQFIVANMRKSPLNASISELFQS